MQTWVGRGRRGVGLAIAGVGLLGTMIIIFWAHARLGRDHNAETNEAYSHGDWDKTALLAQRRLRQAPEDSGALRLAARAAARQDRDERAIAIYGRIRVVDMEAEDFFLVGQALGRTGQTEPAIKALESGRAGNPDHAETLDLLCRLLFQVSRYFAAEEVAERLSRQPDREARARLLLGTVRAELDDPEGVAEALQRWLELDPTGREGLPDPLRSYQFQLARALLRTRQPAKARELLQRVLESGPDDQATWLLSRTYVQGHDWKRAETLAKEVPLYRKEHPLELEPAPYVGEARCSSCHRSESESVLAS